jgi:hypothetical protein
MTAKEFIINFNSFLSKKQFNVQIYEKISGKLIWYGQLGEVYHDRNNALNRDITSWFFKDNVTIICSVEPISKDANKTSC